MAKFKCLNPTCEATWEAAPGPQTCAKCGGIIIKWVDYEAKDAIVELLTRTKLWLTTEAVQARTGYKNLDNLRTILRRLAAAGTVERRESPEGEQRAEWRAAGG